jgi:hypothetical protein
MNKDFEHNEVCLAIKGLKAQCNTLSFQYIKDPMLQHQLRNEYIHIGNCLQADYEEGIISKDDVVNYVKKERQSLIDQAFEISKYGIGIISGVAQVTSGYAVCASIPLTTVAGVAMCGAVGLPMSGHGMNNIYENSASLMDFLRGDQEINHSGWVRDAYRYASKKAGYTKKEADLAYSSVDLATSLYGLHNVLKKVPYANVPDARQFKLFRALASDYQKGWRTMSGTALSIESIGNAHTLNGMKNTYNE